MYVLFFKAPGDLNMHLVLRTTVNQPLNPIPTNNIAKI